MKETNTTRVFGADISAYTDKAIAEAILALQEEQKRRAKIRDYELIRKFKEVAQQLFDAHIMVHIEYDDTPIYFDGIENFIFDDFD